MHVWVRNSRCVSMDLERGRKDYCINQQGEVEDIFDAVTVVSLVQRGDDHCGLQSEGGNGGAEKRERSRECGVGPWKTNIGGLAFWWTKRRA